MMDAREEPVAYTRILNGVAVPGTDFEGDVTTFEPSPKMLEILQETVSVNGVADIVTVEHAAAGSVSDSSTRIFGLGTATFYPP